ncbi:TonB-dependent receptor [Rufibacter immobilis]|uniref:TonB-dependent receptor n=1 Tax=Rufibacter immobilis TaxID=1348778 RepID=UPI0035E87CC9
MKLSLILLLVTLLRVNAEGYAQKITLDVTNVPLENALKELRKQSGYDFLYSQSLIKKAKPVSAHMKDVSLQEALQQLFAGQPFNYTVKYNTVVLKEGSKQQVGKPSTMEVKGQVVDENRSPMPGTTVLVKGTQIATSTSAQGEFKLAGVPEDGVLVISFLGYQTREIKASPNVGEVILEPSQQKLSEVVVVGYGTQKREDLTGSVVSLKPTETEAATFTSLDKLMQGKVAGVNISATTSQPGAANSVIIRGANSLRGDNQPLYVVDNIPLESTTQVANSPFGGGDVQTPQNPLASINPQDIESIEVLKDASATAIYGSRGANGVILITTKKGKRGKAKINFSYNATLASLTRKREILGLQDYARFQNALNEFPANQNYFFEGSEVRYVNEGQALNYKANDPSTYRTIQEIDWQDEMYQKALSHNYNVGVSGGSDNMTYYLSGGFKDIEGIGKGTGMKIGNLRANLTANLTDKLSTNLVMDGSIRRNNMMQGGNVSRGTGNGSITRSALMSQPHLLPADEALDDETRTTVYSWLNDYDDITNTYNFRTSVNLKYDISNSLNYQLRIGGSLNNLERSRWFGLQLAQGLNENGSLGVSEVQSNNYTVENLISFNKQLGSLVRVEAVAGATYDDYNWLNKIYNGSQFDIHSLRTEGLHLANTVQIFSPLQADYQITSFLARTNFDLADGKYIATLNFRADGSSRFKQDKWGYFPSAALAWKLEEEAFIKSITAINQLKLRGGWGITGSQGISPYSTISEFGTTDVSYADKEGNKLYAASAVRLANEKLTWETTTSYNLGTDFGFFDNRLSGSIDVYRKKTSDLLLNKSIPTSNGFGSLPVNQGAIQNKGVELQLNGDVVKKDAFTLSLYGNIAFNKSKVIDVGQDPNAHGIHTLTAFFGNNIGQSFYTEPVNIFAEGYAPALFWGYKTAGIIQDIEELAYLDKDGNKKYTTYSVISGGANPRPGDVKFIDQNGDGVVNDKDKTFIGNPNPDFIYGFGINVNYRQFGLSTSFNGVQGKDLLNANEYFESQTIGNWNIKKVVFDQIWTPENRSNTIPRVNANRVTVYTDRIIEDASFLRMTDITFSFKLPKSLLNTLKIGAASVFLSGKNLVLFTDYSGYDPEVNSFGFDGLRQGIDWNGFPNERAVTLGTNINF